MNQTIPKSWLKNSGLALPDIIVVRAVDRCLLR